MKNSIKFQLEASDKFMEIQVVCKSVVSLAQCQITRGCTLYCLQIISMRKLSSDDKQVQKETALHILKEISYLLALTRLTYCCKND